MASKAKMESAGGEFARTQLGCGIVGWALCEGGDIPKGRFRGAEEMPVDTR